MSPVADNRWCPGTAIHRGALPVTAALADVGAHLVTDRDCLGDVVGRDSDPEVSKRHHKEVVGVGPWGERYRWVTAAAQHLQLLDDFDCSCVI